MATSMQDIADRLGISKNAVSLALNYKPGVSEALRSQVFETANQMNYRWPGKMKRGRHTLLVLIPEYIRNDRYFYSEIYWAIEKRAQENGYQAMLCSVTQDMEDGFRLPDLYHERMCRGILLVGVFQDNYVRFLLALGPPVVIVDHDYDDLKLDAVVTANIAEADRMVTYLIGLGHRTIGFVGAIDMTKSFMERWHGYLQAMRRAGLSIDESRCMLEKAPLTSLHYEAEGLNMWLDQLDERTTAWFCANDRIAINLIQVLTERNVQVPQQVSVAGFDDIEAAALITPPLTTVQVQREQLGYEAVDFLIRKIDYGGSSIKLSIYGKLVERGSCAQVGRSGEVGKAQNGVQ